MLTNGGRRAKKPQALPKICYIYPIMVKLGSVIPYLNEIHIIYESRDTPLSSADISIFSTEISNFVISRNTDIDCILVHNF